MRFARQHPFYGWLFLSSINIVEDKIPLKSRQAEAYSLVSYYLKASQVYFMNHEELANSSKDLSEFRPIVGCEKISQITVKQILQSITPNMILKIGSRQVVIMK